MNGTENPPNDSTEELTALEVLLSKWEPAEVKIDSIEISENSQEPLR